MVLIGRIALLLLASTTTMMVDAGGTFEDKCGFKGTWLNPEVCVINKLGGRRLKGKVEIDNHCDRNMRIKLRPNEDGTLEGSMMWSGHEGVATSGDIAESDEEGIIGYYNEDDCTFTAVETQEYGTLHGRMTKGNRIHMTLTEPGPTAIAWQAEFKRKKY